MNRISTPYLSKHLCFTRGKWHLMPTNDLSREVLRSCRNWYHRRARRHWLCNKSCSNTISCRCLRLRFSNKFFNIGLLLFFTVSLPCWKQCYFSPLTFIMARAKGSFRKQINNVECHVDEDDAKVYSNDTQWHTMSAQWLYSNKTAAQHVACKPVASGDAK